MTLYIFLKYIHVLSAVIAFGANITYILWLNRVRKAPEAIVFTLRTVKIIDDRLATPAYILLFPSGLWLASLAGWRLTTPWILASLILYAALSIIGLGIYTPALRRQITIAESLGSNAPEYKLILYRSNAIGIFLNILGLMIIYLMIAKPALWG